MVRWLKSRRAWRPQRLDRPPEESDEGARVEPDFAAGSVILQRGDRLVSLVWSGKDKDRRRALPVGEYLLRTTRLEREKKGVWWFLSSTGPAKKKVRITNRSGDRLSIDDVVRFRGRVTRRGRELQLGFAITGTDGRGLSVYRAGRRVPVSYEILDGKGKVLARGRMNYG